MRSESVLLRRCRRPGGTGPRPGRTARRSLLLAPALAFLLVILAALAAGAVPALAQDDDDETPPLRPLLPDSAASRNIIDRLGVKPQYSTNVEIFKTNLRWSQGLKVARTLGALKLEGSMQSGMQQNEASSNLDNRDGRTKARFEYGLAGLGGWSAGTDIELARVRNSSSFNRTIDNGGQFSAFATSQGPGTLARQLFGLSADVLDWEWGGSIGYKEDTDVRQRLGQGVLQQSDSTWADGSTVALNTRAALSLGPQFKLDLSGQTDRERQTSHTARVERIKRTGQADSINAFLLDPDRNRNRTRNGSATATWTPRTGTRIAFNASYLSAVDEFYNADPTVKKQDRQDGQDERLGLEMKLPPLLGLAFDLKGGTTSSSKKFRESVSQGRGQRREYARGSMSFGVRPGLGPLSRIESTSELSWENSDNTFDSPNSPDFRGRIVSVRQNLRRPLGQRLVVVLTGDGSLNQSFYDRFQNKRQDRDEQRLIGDAAIGYRPREGLDTRLTGQWERRRQYSIDSTLSANSFTQNRYVVGAEIAVPFKDLLRLSQRYTITADYQVYRFKEDANILTRRTEVRTLAQSTIGRGIRFDLDHSWQFKDSGSYREIGFGPRKYAKSTRENYQSLLAIVRYDIGTAFQMKVQQRYDVRRVRNLSNNKVTLSERLEFTGGIIVDHKFRRDFSVKSTIERTDSSLEKSYWRVNNQVAYTF